MRYFGHVETIVCPKICVRYFKKCQGRHSGLQCNPKYGIDDFLFRHNLIPKRYYMFVSKSSQTMRMIPSCRLFKVKPFAHLLALLSCHLLCISCQYGSGDCATLSGQQFGSQRDASSKRDHSNPASFYYRGPDRQPSSAFFFPTYRRSRRVPIRYKK